jgi:hypothetical protein
VVEGIGVDGLATGWLGVADCARAPQDIAPAAVYLGLKAPYVIGQVLAFEGGRSLNV